jgi:hypothetical protein
MESQDWQDNMSKQPVLRKNENPSTSRVILIKQARLADQRSFGAKARLTDSKDLYCVWQVESRDGLPTAFILTLWPKSIRSQKTMGAESLRRRYKAQFAGQESEETV